MSLTSHQTLFTDQLPKVDQDERQLLASILRRALPSEADTARMIKELYVDFCSAL